MDRLIRESKVEKYFGKSAAFSYPDGYEGGQRVFRFSDRIAFGFGGCGYLVEQEQNVEYRFPLVRAHAQHITLSIDILTTLLNAVLAEAMDESATPSNRKQLVSVETFVRVDESMHGHPLGGDIFPTARRWLERYVERTPKARDSWYDERPLPKCVVEAMRSTWRSLSRKDLRKYARESGGSISSDGRFIMRCFGNACDIAMYPDCSPHDSDMPHRFSCHNLDGPVQQLTLLAGLAALFQMIANENE